jgi:amino acid adenylation domain-containing protein
MTDKSYPLSLPQRDIYYEQLLHPDSSIYNIGAKIQVQGDVQPFFLILAIKSLIERHKILRSVFVNVDGVPYMHVADNYKTEIDYLDLSFEPDPHKAAELFINGEFNKPFDLSGDSLLHKHWILKVSKSQHIVFASYHHLIADGWSTSLLLSQVADIYSTIKYNQPDNKQPEFAYTDFIEDDLSYLDSPEFELDQAYWKKKCEAHPGPAFLPVRKDTTPVVTGDTRRKAFYIDRETYNAVIKFSVDQSVTTFHFWIGIILTYFSSLIDDNSLILGLPILNRKNKKFKQTIGLFASITPLFLKVNRSTTFRNLLRDIRSELKENFRHQRLPLSTITANAGWMKGNLQQTVYQVFFSYEKHDYSVSIDGCPCIVTPLLHQMAQTPLAIYVREFDDYRDVKIDFDYNTSFFDTGFIESFSDRFQSLIHELLLTPDKPINTLRMLSEQEEREQLTGYNNMEVGYEVSGTLMELLETQLSRSPQSVALEFEGTRLSYTELHERSNRLGHCLRAQYGVGRNDLIGLMTDRTDEMVTAILGILKSGGAYVPVDPDHPASRRDYILERSGIKVIVTEEKYRSQLEQKGYRCIVQSELSHYSTTNLPVINHSGDLAYVMYTSGSTGNPKGVEIEHHSVVNFLKSMQQQPGIGASDRLLAVTTYSFDISVLELLLPLVSGATVIVLRREQVQDAVLLGRKIAATGATLLQCTPSMWQMLLEGGWTGDPKLKALSGGERLSKALAGRLLEKVKELWNMYGPTETTIWSASRCIRHAEEAVSLGWPIGNTEIFLLNKDLQLLPTGISGDLYIGGEGLARGYREQPQLTEEKFIAHPFRAGARLYATGDVGRRLADGSIEFLGRSDEQVKIRGYRVELAEIEHVLLKHPLINAAVVVTLAAEDGTNFLVGYVVLSGPVTATELRLYVKEVLPDYMVPGYFITLNELPVSSNGKIDKKRLPALGESHELGLNTGYVAPTTKTEEQLVAIWEDTLGRRPIGIKDNFFEIGGHSLRAVQILSRIHRELGVELGLQYLFANATIAELAQVVTTKEKAEVYASIPVIAERPYYELSHGQRRLWILSRFAEGSLAYNVAGAYRIKGRLDITSFTRALKQITARHESLRTIFITVDGVPVQKIIPAAAFNSEIEEHDLRGVDAWDRAAVMARAELETVFDLSRGPLMRTKLLRTAEEEYVLLLTLHHIITDGWSMEVIVRELMQLYSWYRNGEENRLAPLPLQYKDYAYWQNELLRSSSMEAHRAFWLNQFKGNIPVLELPADFQRPVIQTFRGHLVEIDMDPLLCKQLQQLSSAHSATLFMSLLTIFKILLYRYTGQTDLVIGTPVAGREHTDLYSQVGFFVNMVALRTTVNAHDSFAGLLEKVKQVILNGYAHQAYPFDTLVDDLALPRDMSRSPIFDVVVGMEAPVLEKGQPALDGLMIKKLEQEHLVSKYDCSLTFKESEKGIHMSMEYNTALFKKETIDRLLEHYVRLTAAIIAAPGKPINTLRMLSEQEEREQLTGYNNMEVGYEVSGTLMELLETQLSRSPQSVALEFEGTRLSYTELHERSNRLGHCLRAQYGVGRNDLIGLMTDRTDEMVTAILGILKSGGAYVPVDPDHPASRRDYILERSGIKVIVTEEKYRSQLEQKGYRCIVQSELSHYSTTNLPVINHSGDLAYVMYTSGSTGNPKGVEIEHHSVVNFLKSMQQQPGIGASDRLLAVTTYSFDISVLELLLPLVSGATVIVLRREQVQDAVLLGRKIAATGATLLQCTPSMWQMLLEGGWTGDPKLKALSGGERLSKALAGRLLEKVKELWNMYGPTETTIWSASRCIRHAEEAVSLGWPIGNTEIFLLNKDLQLLPTGISGDLYIGGEGLARGYREQPQLTEEKFIAHPFRAGARLYATGDVGRRLADGSIEFLGRSDEQVKIRGYRVELAEIEHVLLKHPLINAAVVVTLAAEDGTNFLVGYVVLSGPVTATELRLYVKEVLPDYMVPGYFITLNELPVSSNGKIDKKRLPALGESHELGLNTGYVAPTTKTEEQLVAIWEDTLGRRPIGIKDNFFEIGGHSLRAVQILSRIHRELGVELGLQYLFANATIAELAQVVTTKEKAEVYASIPVIAERPYYELSHGQRRLWILSRFAEGSLAYNVAGAYRIKGRLDITSFTRALKQITARHESLRTIFITVDGVPVQKIIPAAAFNSEIEEHDLRGVDAWDRAAVMARAELETVFDLSRGPLMRTKLLRTAEEEYVLLLTLHHIITDGWSMEVIVRELMQLYSWYRNGEENRLAPLPLQYKDYAYWQNELLRSSSMEAHRAFWLNQFKGNIPVLELPADFQRPAVLTHRGGRVRGIIDPEKYRELLQLSLTYNTSLYTMLLALVKALLYRYTGQKEIIVGYPIAMRDHTDLENQVGFYLNTLPLKTVVEGGNSFIEILQKVNEGILHNHAHQLYPFEKIVSGLGASRNTSRSPLFDVVVVLQNLQIHKHAVTGLDDLTVDLYDIEQVTSSIDLRLEFLERADHLVIHFDYNSGLFKPATVQLFMDRFLAILEQAVTDPHISIDEFIFKNDNNLQRENNIGSHFTIKF